MNSINPIPIKKYAIKIPIIKEKPVKRAFFLLSGSATSNEAISKIKIANSQGLIASTPAPQITAKRVILNVWTDGSQTSV